jgi:YVTN family beta-propeller protein
MKVRRILILSSLAVTLGCALHAQTTPRTSLLALSKQDHTLNIIDPASLKVVATVPVGEDPHEVTVSADGRTAYVSNYGYGAYHTLSVVDLVGQKALPPIDLGPFSGPHGLMFEGGKVWFTAEGARVIGSYDPATGKVVWVMGTGQSRTHLLYVFPGGKRIVNTNVSSGTVTIFDDTEGQAHMPAGPRPPLATRPEDWVETVIPAGRGPEGFDVSPDGKEAWVENTGDGTITVIDLASKRVATTLSSNTLGANRLKFTPDGKLVLVAAKSAVVVLDAAKRKEVQRLTTVPGLGGIQVQPDGARAYVSCEPDGFVAVIDLKTFQSVGRINLGAPDGLAWAVQR